MKSGASSLVERMERILSGVTVMAVEMRNHLERLYGDRPLLWGEGDKLDMLERYLDVRDNPGAWAVLFEEQRQRYGRDAGEMQMLSAIVEMEELLTDERRGYGGAEAVYAALLHRRIRRAEPILKQIERIDAMPEYEVRPALPGYDELAALTALAAGESPEFQPVIQTPADVAPPTPGGMTPYGNG